MNLNNQETILRQFRLHKGIFCLPALVFVLPLFPAIALCFLISLIHQKTNAMFQPLQGQSIPPGLIYLPLLMLAVPWLLACGVSFVSTLITYLKSEITLTNQRLLFRTGFIMRVSGELPLENIEAIFLIEPLLGRILGYGTISLTSVGGVRFPLRFMPVPQEFHAGLQRAVAAARTTSVRAKPPASAAPATDDHSRFQPKG